METLKGKVALVTGGGGGLGQATCRTLAAAGAIVISADVSRDLAENVCGAICAEGGRALPCRLDVTAEGQVEQVIDQVVAEHGRLDVLINNAGVDVTPRSRIAPSPTGIASSTSTCAALSSCPGRRWASCGDRVPAIS